MAANCSEPEPSASSSQVHWKHVWLSSSVLGHFVCTNRALFERAAVVELGAGATGLPSALVARVCRPRVQRATDVATALPLLAQNSACPVIELNWEENSPDAIDQLVRELPADAPLVLLGADVFYDPAVFEPLLDTIQRLIERRSEAVFYFVYQNRDDSWSIEPDLLLRGLVCQPISCTLSTNSEQLQLGVLRKMSANRTLYGGIEGGATHSKLVIYDADGRQVAESEGPGTNFCLDGVEKTADTIATWIRRVFLDKQLTGPLRALGLGLSGAEDETQSAKLSTYMLERHGDIALRIRLDSDAVASVGAAFGGSAGAALIAGTGSSLRLIRDDGSVAGVGGWGHLIGDQGGAFWIASRAITALFDATDGLTTDDAPGDVADLQRTIRTHFEIENETELLPRLYTSFKKAHIAALTGRLAGAPANANPIVRRVFYSAGYELGRHVRAAVAKVRGDEIARDLPVVAVGSVFKSWRLLEDGFRAALAESPYVAKVRLYHLERSTAHGAAALAAKADGVLLFRGGSNNNDSEPDADRALDEDNTTPFYVYERN